MFTSKEAEEEVKKVSQEVVQKVSDTTEDAEAPKVVAPTQEQILAIKVRFIYKSSQMDFHRSSVGTKDYSLICLFINMK